MSINQVIHLGVSALYMILELSLPVLLVALVVGVAISLVQAMTQVQEMTLTFVPKIISVFLCIALIAPWMVTTMVDYTRSLFMLIPNINP